MTVNTTTSRADYTGNGVTTAFTVPFYFLDVTHLTVLRTVIATGVSTTLALNVDYTVTGAGVPAGGTVTCTVAPTATQKISILRNVPFTQLTDYVPNDPFPAESHERALDQLTMLAQQVNENLGRAITLPAATTGVSTGLPSAQPSQLLGFNGTGSALTTYDPASLLTIAGSSGFSTQTFNGTGAQTAFTLSASPGAIANLEVFISGVRQRPTTDYTLSDSTLTFVSGAPASGTGNILVRWGTTLGIGVPSDTSVTTAKIADANVTTAKIADGNVTLAKLAADAQFTDTTRIDVASAATVDLSTLAPNTRNINITGTTTITGFTIAVGRLYFVRFNAALTLTNNASIITQTGANIATAAGDTCIIRATAANTVEVLCYAKLLVRGASVASTSGTSIDFTGLPSWVKRITIQFSGVSTTGSSSYQVQIGSGSFSTSGYSSVSGGGSNAGALGCTGLTSGFAVTGGTFTGANAFTGALVLTMITNNTFVMQGNLCIDGTTVFLSAAGVSPTLGGALDRVRITTVGGTDTFDAGTINIMYEG